MSLPLSKYYDPADYVELAEELAVVDQHFTKAAPQSEHRRWEYAMALRAENTWRSTYGRDVYRGYDVGGAGSPFRHMASVGEIIDPHEPYPNDYTLAQYCVPGAELGGIVFCLSVLEHVDDLDQFLYHLSCLTAPGGLLFLTMDCCGCGTHTASQDPHHFAAMRKRIFTRSALDDVWDYFTGDHQYAHGGQNFSCLGGVDFDHYQPRLYGSATDPGYSFASLALVKRS